MIPNFIRFIFTEIITISLLKHSKDMEIKKRFFSEKKKKFLQELTLKPSNNSLAFDDYLREFHFIFPVRNLHDIDVNRI